ncbi:TrmB family transcriptional regulator sugar-binding domain-containing protein [Streptomyces sp. NPDC005900]|uniref:TrmB family transcriptional regulator sugar-binding domain-containing protein n=1 Tax=unclassified Streptomyces TaxID=2593676 RepID=UPI00340CB0B6
MLLEARRLVETAVDRHRSEGRLVAALDPDEGSVGAATEQVVASAGRTLAVVLSGKGEEETLQLIGHLGRAAARGVEVQLLGRVGLLEDRVLAEHLDKYAPGVEARLARGPLQEMVLADGAAGVVWSRSGLDVREAVLVHASAVLRNLRTLFSVSWSGSAALSDYRSLSDRSRSALARRILLALNSGRTDEVAARELGMSVRTYRRNVAEITRELGANSRFQAGARAVELGLLAPLVERPVDRRRAG